MRIGTWNLEKKWTQDHADLMEEQKCDVWLLTEVVFNLWKACNWRDGIVATAKVS